MAKRKLPAHGDQSQQQIDLSKADTLKCESCENYLFITY
jgi:hypothetical protein